MTCPMCEGKVHVVYCLSDVDSIIRKRQCCECGYIFYTSETEDASAHSIFTTLRNEQVKKQKLNRRKALKGGAE